MPKNTRSKLHVTKVIHRWRWGNNPTKDENLSQRVAIWTNCYSHSVDHIKWLSKILKKDFPWLKDGDMEVCTYGGVSKNGMLGIEFNLPENRTISKDYAEVSWMDKHLG